MLNKDKYELFKASKREWIEVMEYSPCGNYLAVGSHDNKVYIFSTKSYKLRYKMDKHSSFITGIDWSQDSTYIRSVCGAYELLFYSLKMKK